MEGKIIISAKWKCMWSRHVHNFFLMYVCTCHTYLLLSSLTTLLSPTHLHEYEKAINTCIFIILLFIGDIYEGIIIDKKLSKLLLFFTPFLWNVVV